MIHNDLITCARYYDHKTLYVFAHYSTKTHLFLDKCVIFLVIKFQNSGSEPDHGLLWIKDAPIYGINTNEEIENFVNKYISCYVSLLPITLQNAQQHQHTQTCNKKNHVVMLSLAPHE